MSLLTLDQTTLFYWNLSNQYLKPQFTGTNEVVTWIDGISKKPSSHATNSTPTLVNSKSATSRATSATRPPPSVLSEAPSLLNGTNVSGKADGNLMEHGAISDRDETQGEEYESKRKSPVKGVKRLESGVSMSRILSLITCTNDYLAQSKG